MIGTILITNDPKLVREAQEAGVSRFMVDLETLGKKERQASRKTFISTHQPRDIASVRAVLDTSCLIVRINPWHAGSGEEIKHALGEGADILMLPMITGMAQLESFLDCVDGKAQALPLVETAYSMQQMPAIAALPEVPEIYIGLNDLHLSLGLTFLFEPLALGLVDDMAQIITRQGKRFGFGGMAAIGGGQLPAERILGEHVRLGSSLVILSSQFARDVGLSDPAGRPQRLQRAMMALRERYQALSQRSQAQQEQDKADTFARIRALADNIKSSH